MRRCEHINLLLRELKNWPGATYELHNGSKHNKLRLIVGDQSQHLVVAGSPSCSRGARNAVARMRRKLREMGARRMSNA